MRLASNEQMREIDSKSGNEVELMETAGEKSFQCILKIISERKFKSIGIIAGPGNNGGDALVVARKLKEKKLDFSLFIFGNKKSKLFELQFEKLGASAIDLTREPSRYRELGQFDLIVDGAFGTGLDRPVEKPVTQVIELVNKSKAYVVSLDIPSGLDGNTGEVLGAAFLANETFCFGLAKLGCIIGLGPKCSGKVTILDIGFSPELVRQLASTYFAVRRNVAVKTFPKRKISSNKSTHGRLLLIAGSPGMWGASQLSLEAAYRIGAGYVTLATDYDYEGWGAEALTVSRHAPELFVGRDSVVLGPGAGSRAELSELIIKALRMGQRNVVIDADGLMALSEMGDLRLPPSWILTPHEGELGRLMKIPSEEIRKNRIESVKKAVRGFGCIVVLKGFRSLVGAPDGRVFVICSGNPGLAKAGTGDVLSGFIGGLLAQGQQPLAAACGASYFHGYLADEWIRMGNDSRSLMPRDLLGMTPRKLREFSNAR